MLKKLKKYLKEYSKDKTIFDIVLYGSAVKGKDAPTIVVEEKAFGIFLKFTRQDHALDIKYRVRLFSPC